MGPAESQAQHVPTGWVLNRWTTRDGLPVNGLTDVLQTRDGYLWIATWDGLIRFDGVRFVVFNRSNTPEMPGNRLFQLAETADSTLWLRTEDNRLASFKRGVMKSLGPEQGLPGRDVSGLFKDADGVLLIATDQGLYEWNGDGFEEVWRPPDSTPSGEVSISRVLRARDSGLWIGTYDGILYEARGEQTHVIDRIGDRPLTSILGLAEDGKGRIWVSAYPWQANRETGRERGLFVVEDRDLRRFEFGDPRTVEARFPGVSHSIYDNGQAIVERDGARFFGSPPDGTWTGPGWSWTVPGQTGHTADGRAFVLEAATIQVSGEPAWTLPISPYRVTWDREGSLWLATNGQGLWRYRSVPFTNMGTAQGYPFDNVYSVLVHSSGEAWAAPLGVVGVSRFEPGQPESARIVLAREAVLSLSEDLDGTVWVGTNTGVCGFAPDGAGRASQRCDWLSLPTPSPGPVYATLRDREGGFWVAGESSLWRSADGRWVRRREPFESSAMGNMRTGGDAVRPGAERMLVKRVRQVLPQARRIRAMAEDPEGVLWFGHVAGGLHALTTEAGAGYDEGRFLHFSMDDGLPSNAIRDLAIEAPGLLWVVTEDAGLARIDYRSTGNPEDARIVRIGRREGLPEDALHTLRADSSGRYWISSNRGLIRVDSKELNAFADGLLPSFHSTLYTDGDGMVNREFNGGYYRASASGPDGRIWFANQGGLVALDPGRLGAPGPPSAVIEAVVAAGVSRLGTSVSLDPDERSFEVVFTGLALNQAPDLRFRYRLVGYDDNWVEAGGRRSAIYTKVPAGKYRFVVAAAGKDGRWDETGADVAITVRPFPYERWWFYLLCVCLSIGVVGMGFRWRIRQLRERQRDLEATVARRTQEIEDEKRRTEIALGTVKEQAEQLRLLDAAKSRFFANISHEFRTPLTLVLGPIRQWLERSDLEEEVRSRLGTMHRNASRLLHLINQLLDLARVDAGADGLSLVRSDLVAFVRNLAALFESVGQVKGVSIVFRSDTPVVEWRFDPEKLEKVVVNLLSNALKFTPSAGTVLVRVAIGASEQAEIQVSDTGIGISPEHLPHVFDRFFQVDASFTRQIEGSGIGLALAHELVVLHGGELTVSSEAGVGTTFTVRLPDRKSELVRGDAVRERMVDPTAPLSVTAYDAAAFVGTASPKEETSLTQDEPVQTQVLVVEDNADLRDYIRSILSPVYEVLEAADGQAGWEAVRSRIPDLIVSDVMMPQMDGMALCRAVRDDVRTSHIPIILLTARADRSSRIDGLETGADDYLAKPFHPDELIVRVRSLIERRRMLRLRYSQSVMVLAADEFELPASELGFLERVKASIHEHLSDPSFGVDRLAEDLGLSRSQVERKLAALVGESPGSLIRRIRMERSAQLLTVPGVQVKGVAAAVGYRSTNQFTEAFRQAHGFLPSEFADRRTAREQGRA